MADDAPAVADEIIEPAPEQVAEAAPKEKDEDEYEQADIFLWANNLVPYVDELKIELYFFTKNYMILKTILGGEVSRQLRPLFVDEILEFVLEGIDQGLRVRDFEEAEKEDNVLQRTKIQNVEKMVEVFNWLKTQQTAIETFTDEEHDLRRMKGVVAVCSHKSIDKPFYVFKNLPTSQIMKGHTAWMLKDNVFKPFDQMSALKIPGENQLLAVGDDLFVFSQSKLKQLFGYDAKASMIARQKVAEIENNFKLSFLDGMDLNTLVKDKPATIRKLQNIQPSLVSQQELLQHAEDIGVEMMEDDDGAIIIMDGKDLTKFVNLLNDDYVESPMTGQRYEILRKKLLKQTEDDGALPS